MVLSNFSASGVSPFMLPLRKVIMAHRLSPFSIEFFLAVFLVALTAPQLDAPTVQANDGTGLDKVTWSGTIRIDSQHHNNQSSSSSSSTDTSTVKTTAVSEYQVEGLPHDASLGWFSRDVRVQVRSHEVLTSESVDKEGYFDRNSQTIYDGSGTTTADVHLILRGEGGTGKDTCWLETGPIGQGDNGEPGTKAIDYPGAEHDWGWERAHSVDETRHYDVTRNVSETIQPLDVRMEIPCATDARSLVGTKETENSNGWVERVTYDLRQEGEAQTEVELVPPDGYEQWMPQGDKDEKTIGNDIDVGIVAHAKGDPSLKPPKKVLKYTITLEDTSQEKGVDCNWPDPDRATTDYDMKIDPDNGWIKVPDDKGQSAETKQEGLTEFRVTINSYDWGGYAKLKVVAELEGGQSVVAHVRGHSDQVFLAIPQDDNNNHIADWWEHFFDLKNTDPSADDDDFPQGDGDKGDSIALYDEYRGFHIGGKHDRLSPELKDLFIVDQDGLGAGVYPQTTMVQVHLLKTTEWSYKEGARNVVLVTGNSHYIDVYALYLKNDVLENGVVGDTVGGPSVPRDIERVKISTSTIRRGYQANVVDDEIASTIAHELGHGTNVKHHGDAPPDYSTGDVRCKLPDGSFRNFLCNEWPRDAKKRAVGPGVLADECYVVAARGGAYSGNDQCFMRYDSANYYENPNGNCQWQNGGKTVHGYPYGEDPPGMTMCRSGKGTGVNDPSNPNNKAGDASPSRGDCIHKFCMKNSAHSAPVP